MKLGEWKVFLYTSIGVTLVFTNMTTMDVALPSIVRYFEATPTEANWILLGYMLVNTVMILAFGRLADMLGRTTLYLVGMGIFTVGSLGCAVAWSAPVLIGFRVLQALGAASVVTNNTALLTDAFPAHKLPVVLGLNATVAAAASICGPLLGGAMVSWLGWRELFWFNVPFGVLSLVWGRSILRRRPPGARERFDVLGTLLSFVALGGLVYALSIGGERGWGSGTVLGWAALGLAAGVLFVYVQLHRTHPLIDLAILRDRNLVLAYYANFVVALLQISALLLVSLFVQAVFGMTALEAGVRVMPLAVGLTLSASIAGHLSRRIAWHILASAGMAVTAAALVGMVATFGTSVSQSSVMAMMAMIGAGCGLFTTPNTASIMMSVPSSRRGIANGVRSMMQNLGYVLGTALSLALVTAPLGDVARHAVYAGRSRDIAAAELLRFEGQYRLAFAVLAILAISATVASACRRVTPVDRMETH